ncbi:hypothetical protein D3C73_849460 [compost metagenome]
MLEQCVSDKAIAAALADQLVEADVQLAKLLDVEMLDRACQQALHGAAQQGQALRVGVEVGAEQRFGLENQPEFEAFLKGGEAVQRRSEQPRLPRPALDGLVFSELLQGFLRGGAADAIAAHQFADADAVTQAPGHAIAQYRSGQFFFLGLGQYGAERLAGGGGEQAITLAGFVTEQVFLEQHIERATDQRA